MKIVGARATAAALPFDRLIPLDETPVSLLAPGRGKTKKAYVWRHPTAGRRRG